MTLDEFATGLKRLSDDAIFPEVPTDQQITIAPKNLDGSTIHIKRPALKYYLGAEKEAECATKDQVLAEVFTTESISKTPHPYLVRYHGCTVRRGRITGIAMERLGETLSHYARCPGGCISEHKTMFDQIDKQAFLAGVESAVKFLHSLGLAHNDINPRNIMVREARKWSSRKRSTTISPSNAWPSGGMRTLTQRTTGETSPPFLRRPRRTR